MNKKEYKEFIKRYDKFKNNNLPTPFWDKERLTFEYVFYEDKRYYNKEESVNELQVFSNLINALEEITNIGLYYSFTDKHIITYNAEDNKTIEKLKTPASRYRNRKIIDKQMQNML